MYSPFLQFSLPTSSRSGSITHASIDINQPKKATEPKADNEVGTEIKSGRACYTSSGEQGAPFNAFEAHGCRPAVANGGRRLGSALYQEVLGKLARGSSLLKRRFRSVATWSCMARVFVRGEVRFPGRPVTWDAMVAYEPVSVAVEVAITSRFSLVQA